MKSSRSLSPLMTVLALTAATAHGQAPKTAPAPALPNPGQIQNALSQVPGAPPPAQAPVAQNSAQTPAAPPPAGSPPPPPPTGGGGGAPPAPGSPSPLTNPNQPAPASGDPTQNAGGALFDNRLPAIDPSGGLIRFNGQTWNITDNAVFRGRFEKFLNTPEENGDEEKAHRETLSKIIGMLDPSVFNANTVSNAYRLLARAASYRGDSRLSDTIANAIYAVWASKRNQARMEEANRILEEENERIRTNMARRGQIEADSFRAAPTRRAEPGTNSGAAPRQGGGGPPAQPPGAPASPRTEPPPGQTPGQLPPGLPQAPGQPPQQGGGQSQAQIQPPGAPGAPIPTTQELQSNATSFGAARIAGYAEKMVENYVKIRENSLKGGVSELQAKLEYQGLLVQLFLQRRFHHVVIGCRFYRAIFSDGDSKLQLPEQNQALFTKGSGFQATVSTIEALTNELMREAQTSVQAFHRLYEFGELRSGAERLRDALMVGEFMPEVRTVPFERKRRVLSFIQKGSQLQAAIETRDYTLAQELIAGPEGLKALAKDFDATLPNSVIETARNAARLHLAKARNAAVSGDKAGFEASLAEAGKIWPNNPELQEVASKAFAANDQMSQALVELDQLIGQKNFRRIAEDAGRFLAATHNAPAEKQQQLKAILEDFKGIETALLASKELDRLGNPAGAWETLDKIAQKFPDDLQINQSRALYTTRAADFVRTVQTAREHETRSQLPSSLAWYLKAQRLYPKSALAEEAVQRLKQAVMPQTAPTP